jgi:hypothetical protein
MLFDALYGRTAAMPDPSKVTLANLVLRESPACGVAAATPKWARAAIGQGLRAAKAVADDPDAS